MRLTLDSGKQFRDTMEIVSSIVNEVKLKISNDGMELVAMDPGSISMVVLKILPTSFKEFKVEEESFIGINLNDLTQILKRMKLDDELSLEIQENKLLVDLLGKTKRKFILPLLELGDNSKKIPSLNFPVKFEMESERLSEAISDAKIVSDSITLKVKGKTLIVEAEDNLNKVEETFEDLEITNTIEGDNEVKSKYSLDYLEKMISKKVSDKVLIQVGDVYPVKVEYKIIDKLMLSFILAPRMDTE